VKKWLKGLTIVVFGLAIGGLAGLIVQRPTKASANEFNPGLIISDEMFFTPGTMTVEEIQALLAAGGGSCVGTSCLKVYREDVPNVELDRYCGKALAGGNLSAAEIIWRVSEACGVNPQVILVMLQKEQGLITTAAPSAWNMRAAMGYGCPDGLPCSGEWAGFFSQVYYGTRQFQVYRQRPELFALKVGVAREIQYHPTASCGSTTVMVQNQATVGLYLYTPYQPNQALLTGTADNCSSYGNYNFWNLFTSWFGNPLGGEGTLAMEARAAAVGSGVLGTKNGAVACLPQATECAQPYSNGMVYWSKSYGAWEVTGAAYQKLAAAGGVATLGYPTGALVAMAVGAGNTEGGAAPTLNVQQFSRGAVVADGATTYALLWPANGEVDFARGWLVRVGPNQGIKTGDQVMLTDTDGAERLPMTAVVLGDVNGDGALDLTDLVQIGRHLANKAQLEGVYHAAGNVANEETLMLTSLVKVGRHLAGKELIK
jgi:hypothetical protein